MQATDHALGGPLPSPLPTGAPDLLAAFWTMTEWEQERFLRYVQRMADRDLEVVGLSELMVAGKITRRQLLELV